MNDHRRAVVAPLLLALLLVAGWQLTVAAGADPLFVPAPAGVARSLVALLGSASVWPYVGGTALSALGGAALGTAVAVPLGIALHRSRWFNAAVAPFLGATQSIPAIALAPLLVLWVGYGTGAIVVLCALIVFFPIVVATSVGLRHVDPAVVDASMLDGASGWQRLVHVELPLAMPQLLAGVRTGVALAVTGAIVGEMVMGGKGLGTLLVLQRDRADTAGMIATILLLCVLSSTAYLLVRRLEGLALRHAGLSSNHR